MEVLTAGIGAPEKLCPPEILARCEGHARGGEQITKGRLRTYKWYEQLREREGKEEEDERERMRLWMWRMEKRRRRKRVVRRMEQ